MDRAEITVRNMLTAVEAPLYDIGVPEQPGDAPRSRRHTRLRGDHPPCVPQVSQRARFAYIHSPFRTNIASPCSTISPRPRSYVALGRRLQSLRRGRDKCRQLPGLAEASCRLSKTHRNLRRTDACKSIRCGPERGGLETIRQTPRLYKLQTQVQQARRSLPFRSSEKLHRRTISDGRDLRTGNHETI